jgi:membrane-bound serine protease (ClpP class)
LRVFPRGINPGRTAIPRFLYLPAICIGVLLAVIGASATGSARGEDSGSAQPVSGGRTFVIPISDTIDLGLAYYVKRSVEEAEREGYNAIILDVDTLGGRVDAALDIRDALESCRIPVTSYVNKRAISAGALICLSTGRITMTPGSTIGAATPISIGPTGQASQLSEKEVSYVRSEFRATAERNGHSALLAEAMVDADTEVYATFDGPVKILSAEEAETLKKKNEGMKVETISPKGKLLTMTASEAHRVGLAESTPSSLDVLMQSLDLDPAQKVVSHSTWSEQLVRFLTHPIVSGLLLTLGVLGILFELQMPGWGISGTLGAIFLVLFFGGHFLAGLANFTDVLLFMIGLGLLALEVFVIPGFGIAGISGIICILLSLYLAVVKRPIPKFSWDFQRLNSVLLMFFFVLAGIIAGTIILWRMFPHLRFGKHLVLSQAEHPSLGYTSGENLESLIGSVGTSLTHLRPAGRALINQQPLEVQTLGDFIEKDRKVKVVKVVGNKVFVAEEQLEEKS